MVRVFASGLGGQGSIRGQVIRKIKKSYLMPLCLTLRPYKEEIEGKWSYPGKGLSPCQHFSTVAIEKGAFGSPSTQYIYIYKCNSFCHREMDIVTHVQILRLFAFHIAMGKL